MFLIETVYSNNDMLIFFLAYKELHSKLHDLSIYQARWNINLYHYVSAMYLFRIFWLFSNNMSIYMQFLETKYDIFFQDLTSSKI